MELTLSIIAGIAGIMMLVGGAVIAVIGMRRAPDGFEDREGCHLHRRHRNEAS